MSAVTGISGIQLSAASAAYAPTNSADVSAIASAYAESAVSSKLDESATADFYSTANPSGFITGVDLSNYATTAYVDSSVSSKLDTTAFNSGDFYSTSNPSGFITGVDLSNYATTAYVDSSISSFVDSAYVESQVSGKQDTLSFSYDDDDKISAINGSALAGGGGGGEADWSAESGQPGYIENKPVPKTLVAGQGITITENSTGLVVASTNTLYTAGSGLTLNGTTFAVDTATVQGKLTYDYDASGNISGIDGSALVGGDPEATDLYVQAPLYTGVSGGSAYIGSHINQTVLWTGTGTTTGGTITLSESLSNFERYGMYYYIPYQESGQEYYQELVYKSGQTAFGIKTDGITDTLWRQYIDYGTMNETSISIVSGRQGGFWLTGTDRAFNLYDGNDRHHYFTKVVGINRTAGE